MGTAEDLQKRSKAILAKSLTAYSQLASDQFDSLQERKNFAYLCSHQHLSVESLLCRVKLAHAPFPRLGNGGDDA